jgi:hypothetical protein
VNVIMIIAIAMTRRIATGAGVASGIQLSCRRGYIFC